MIAKSGETMNTHLENYYKHFPSADKNEDDATNCVLFSMVEMQYPEDLPKYEALLDMAIERNKPLTEQEVIDALEWDINPYNPPPGILT
jgi:hypothetical protein